MAPNCCRGVSTCACLALLYLLTSQVTSAGGVQTINLSAEAVSQSQISIFDDRRRPRAQECLEPFW